MVLAIGLGLAAPNDASAALGDADPLFGVGGTATLPAFPDVPATRRQVARDSSGRILVAGRSGRGDIIVERVLPDASRDRSFGDGGRVTIDLGSVADDVAGIRVRDDGRILVGGSSDTALVVIGLRADGSRDPSWGTDGVVAAKIPRLPTPYDPATPGDALVQADVFAMGADGGVALGGSLSDTGQGDHAGYAILRLDASGHRVTTFRDDGIARLAPLNTNLVGGTILDGMALADDGSVLVTGVDDRTRGRRAVAWFTPEGSPRWSNQPVVPDAMDPDLDLRPREPRPSGTGTAQILPDGRFLVGRTGLHGESSPYERRPMLTRFLRSGAADPSFGDGGTVVDPSLRPGTAVALADGSVFALTTEGAVRRLAPDGTALPDRAPDVRGDAIVPAGSGVEVVDLDAGGRPGAVSATTLGADGRVVDSTASDDALRGGAPATAALDVAPQSDGRLVVLTGVDGRTGGLSRITRLGTVDRTFGSGGVVPAPTGTPVTGAGRQPQSNVVSPTTPLPQSFAVDSQDRIVVPTGGLELADGTRSPTEVRRYTPDGRVDPTWNGGSPVLVDGAASTAPRVVVAGGDAVTVLSQDRNGGAVLVRLRSNGTLDPGWGVDGRFQISKAVPIAFPTSVVAPGGGLRTLPDGRTIVAVQSDAAGWSLFRLRADGRLDTGYGEDGWAFRDRGTFFERGWWPGSGITEGSVRFTPDGRAFMPGLEGGVPTVRVVAADGSGTDADVVVQPLSDLPYRMWSGMPLRTAVQADGRILLASADARGTLGVARLEPGGQPDEAWGERGVARSQLFDGRLAVGTPAAVEALPDGSAVVLGDADGDGTVLRLVGGGVATPVTPAVWVESATLDLERQDDTDLHVRLSRPSSTRIAVRVSTENVSGSADPVDRTIAFAPGETDISVPVHVLTGSRNTRIAVRLRATSDDARPRNRPGDPAGSAVGNIFTEGERLAPRNVVLPHIDPAVSPYDPKRLQCYTGAWRGTEGRYTFEWLRDGRPVPGETGPTTPLVNTDGTGFPPLTCRVTLTNDLGTATVESRPFGESFPGYGIRYTPRPPAQVPFPLQAGPSTPKRPATPSRQPATGSPTTPVSGVRITGRRVTWRAGTTGTVTVRVDALGSTRAAVRRARVPARQTRAVTVAKTGATGAVLARRPPAGRYRVRITSGRRATGEVLSDTTVRVPARR